MLIINKLQGILGLCLFVLLQQYHQIECQQQSQQRRSPCPSVFTYDSQPSDIDDTWYGTLKLQSSVQLYGLTVDVIFDRRLVEFGAYHFSEATSSDNIEFRIENKNFQVNPGRTIVMNIYVRYRNNNFPLLKQIRLNGQNVCVDLPTIAVVQPVYRPIDHNIDNPQHDTTTPRRIRENPNK